MIDDSDACPPAVDSIEGHILVGHFRIFIRYVASL